MATCTVKLDLAEIDDKVIKYYKELMDASTAQDSIYLKAKETLNAILDEAGLDSREKSTILSQTIGNMVNGLSTQAMQGAIDLAKDDRDAEYVLAKLCADTELTQIQKDKVTIDIADTEAAINSKIAQRWLTQAQLYRDFGVIPDNLVFSHEELDNIDYNEDYGTKYQEVRLAKANVYGSYAASYRQNGVVLPSIDSEGLLLERTSADSDGLVYWQTKVAKRNEEGFDDNMRQHVANSSATMISMLLSTEASKIDYTPYLDNWSNAITYLNTTKNETAGTITLDTVISISKSTGATITGISSNLLAGSSVTIKIYDNGPLNDGVDIQVSTSAVGIIQLNGTWEVVVTPAMINELSLTFTGNITASTLDSTGSIVSDTDSIKVLE